MTRKPKRRQGYERICRAYVTTRNGKRIYAWWYGKRCFVFWVKVK